jgi:hypothetical protein
VSRRPSLAELRQFVAADLDDEWRTPTDLQHRLGLGGSEWYRLCLTLEWLANDGHAELKHSGSTVRRFRRVTPGGGSLAFRGASAPPQ